MKIQLLGTGSSDGWPNPFCRCASCEAVRGTPDVRGQNSALVDDVLLLDFGADGPRAAMRFGVALDGVRHILLTHAHDDHTSPAGLMWRSWAGRREPLDVVGPPTALARCAESIGPDDPVRLVPALPGETLQVGGYTVRPVKADHDADAVLYDLTAPDGGRLLYATDTGPLPQSTVDALAGRVFDDVLLELTFGTVLGNTDGHLDFVTFPAALAELRRRDAIVDGTRVVAIHLSHDNPPPAELSVRLAQWGAELHRDGDILAAHSAGSPPQRRDPHRTLVLGGARSGKSSWAQSALAAEPAVTFVATAQADPGDPEWTSRIAAHRGARPAGWETVETTDLEPLLDGDGVLLVDDLGNWLSRALDTADAWNDPGGLDVVRKRGDALVRTWTETGARVVLVTNEVGQGVVPATPAGRLFRDELGRLNAALAAAGDEVVSMTAGLPRWLRGAPDAGTSR